MGDLIPFPVSEHSEHEPEDMPDACSGILHVFPEIDGADPRCECGEYAWPKEGLPPQAPFIGVHHVA